LRALLFGRRFVDVQLLQSWRAAPMCTPARPSYRSVASFSRQEDSAQVARTHDVVALEHRAGLVAGPIGQRQAKGIASVNCPLTWLVGAAWPQCFGTRGG
jgi:hypothetical protein